MTPFYLWLFMYKLRWGVIGAACSCASSDLVAAMACFARHMSRSRCPDSADLLGSGLTRITTPRCSSTYGPSTFRNLSQVHHDDLHEPGAAAQLHLLAALEAARQPGADLARLVRFITTPPCLVNLYGGCSRAATSLTLLRHLTRNRSASVMTTATTATMCHSAVLSIRKTPFVLQQFTEAGCARRTSGAFRAWPQYLRLAGAANGDADGRNRRL